MLTTFTRRSDDSSVSVNPNTVRLVSALANGNVFIHFSEEHAVGVMGELQGVISQLNGAMR